MHLCDYLLMTRNMFFFCSKSKEMYYVRCHELDKFRKDGSSAKEVEKVCGFWILKVCHSIISGPVLSLIITSFVYAAC